ncbi:MAG: methyltransferase, FxLD system, partial [Pseudonocardiaceae bacterium]
VGPDGAVTTIDIDPEVVEEAGTRLAAAGYPDVQVTVGDGALGDKTRAPYDRIIVTAGAWDLPPAWWEQLTEGGRIVVPLRWRGQTRSIAFDHQPGRLVSRSVKLCGFIPLRGPDGDGERTVALDDGATVTLYHDEDQPLDHDALHGVLNQPKSQSWSGVTVGSHDPFDGVWLRLTTAEPGTCRIAAQPAAVDSGLVTPAIPVRSPAVIEGSSLAYFALRPHTDSHRSGGRRFKLGAIGHGSRDLAGRITEQIRTWDHDRTAQPAITAHPAGTPDNQLPASVVIDKQHTRLTVSW